MGWLWTVYKLQEKRKNHPNICALQLLATNFQLHECIVKISMVMHANHRSICPGIFAWKNRLLWRLSATLFWRYHPRSQTQIRQNRETSCCLLTLGETPLIPSSKTFQKNDPWILAFFGSQQKIAGSVAGSTVTVGKKSLPPWRTPRPLQMEASPMPC